MSSLLCRKSTKTYGKTEDTIIAHHIPARDIVSHSNCLFGKRRQKICLIALVISSFFPMPESNWKYRMRDCQDFSTSAHVLSLQFDSSTRKPFECPSMPPFHNPPSNRLFSTIRYRLPQLKFLSSNPDRRTICLFKIIQISLLRMVFNIFVPSITKFIS